MSTGSKQDCINSRKRPLIQRTPSKEATSSLERQRVSQSWTANLRCSKSVQSSKYLVNTATRKLVEVFASKLASQEIHITSTCLSLMLTRLTRASCQTISTLESTTIREISQTLNITGVVKKSPGPQTRSIGLQNSNLIVSRNA